MAGLALTLALTTRVPKFRCRMSFNAWELVIERSSSSSWLRKSNASLVRQRKCRSLKMMSRFWQSHIIHTESHIGVTISSCISPIMHRPKGVPNFMHYEKVNCTELFNLAESLNHLQKWLQICCLGNIRKADPTFPSLDGSSPSAVLTKKAQQRNSRWRE